MTTSNEEIRETRESGFPGPRGAVLVGLVFAALALLVWLVVSISTSWLRMPVAIVGVAVLAKLVGYFRARDVARNRPQGASRIDLRR
jgi:hypothetical protein